MAAGYKQSPAILNTLYYFGMRCFGNRFSSFIKGFGNLSPVVLGVVLGVVCVVLEGDTGFYGRVITTIIPVGDTVHCPTF